MGSFRQGREGRKVRGNRLDDSLPRSTGDRRSPVSNAALSPECAHDGGEGLDDLLLIRDIVVVVMCTYSSMDAPLTSLVRPRTLGAARVVKPAPEEC